MRIGGFLCGYMFTCGGGGVRGHFGVTAGGAVLHAGWLCLGAIWCNVESGHPYVMRIGDWYVAGALYLQRPRGTPENFAVGQDKCSWWPIQVTFYFQIQFTPPEPETGREKKRLVS